MHMCMHMHMCMCMYQRELNYDFFYRRSSTV